MMTIFTVERWILILLSDAVSFAVGYKNAKSYSNSCLFIFSIFYNERYSISPRILLAHSSKVIVSSCWRVYTDTCQIPLTHVFLGIHAYLWWIFIEIFITKSININNTKATFTFFFFLKINPIKMFPSKITVAKRRLNDHRWLFDYSFESWSGTFGIRRHFRVLLQDIRFCETIIKRDVKYVQDRV